MLFRSAIDWAVAHGATILSNSWGGGGYSEPLRLAIERARVKDIIFIAAAGNNGASSANYPALYDLPNVVSVAAVDKKDQLASFSNRKDGVHIAAPGVGIVAAKAGGGYVSVSGTSMATPHVAGVVGAVSARHGAKGYEFFIQKLRKVRRTNRLKDEVKWGGVVNLRKGLR